MYEVNKNEKNEDFSIPLYIFEEIKVNNRLTDTQVKHIIDTYCREQKRNDIIY